MKNCLGYIILWNLACKMCVCLVQLELSVLHFDNPLGTSYTGNSTQGHRKCCDTGGSNCAVGTDTCDVYFTFCVGRMPPNSGCVGTRIEIDTDISTDVFKINNTQTLKKYATIATWLQGKTSIMTDVLDIDELAVSSHPNIHTDLIDRFTRTLDFLPSPDFFSAPLHLISYTHHTSLTVGIRAWCARDWYGDTCNQSCSVQGLHQCTSEGDSVPLPECTDQDDLVLTLKEHVRQVETLPQLKQHLTKFIVDTSCPRGTLDVNVTIVTLRENEHNSTDVVFRGSCDAEPVSSLKLRQSVYVLGVASNTRITPPSIVFGVDVDTPKVIYFSENTPTVAVMVRIISYSNLQSAGCAPGRCSPSLKIKFNRDTSIPLTFTHVTNLTDCNGKLVDLTSPVNESKYSTALVLLKAFPRTLIIDVTTRDSIFARHLFPIQGINVGRHFLDAFPVRQNESVINITSLSIEVLAWCLNCRDGNWCQTPITGCNVSATLVKPDCKGDVDCYHGAACSKESCVCRDDAWFGPACNIDVDECALGVCKHANSCDNTPGGYSCSCETGFTGSNCDVNIDECKSNPCTGGSVCLDTLGSYACVCVNGTVSENCGGLLDFCLSNPCGNNGTCTSTAYKFTCHCSPGWQDTLCQHDVDECQQANSCANGATCHNTQGSYTCICADGFTGDTCKTDIDECSDNVTLCQNNGSCSNTAGSYTCNCVTGFTGQNCETDVDDCASHPCVYGTCVDHVGGYTCNCGIGYTGTNCDQDRDECSNGSPCHHGGTCKNTPGSYTCQCVNGWYGPHCEHDVDECTHIHQCQHGSTCINTPGNYTCTCSPQWTGHTCQTDLDECAGGTTCLHGGTCHNSEGGFSCDCPSGWKGDTCNVDVDECSQSTTLCRNGGQCVNVPGSFYCSCVPGWTGHACQSDINECLKVNCSNGGVCANHLNEFECICANGFTGRYCEVNINDCVTGHCQNGGTCMDLVGRYYCVCPVGLTGVLCEKDVNECLDSPPCKTTQTCKNGFGTFTCVDIPTSSTPTTTTSAPTSPGPNTVDIFSLQFVSAVPAAKLPDVRSGISGILRLLNCHDSKHIYVSLVQNSVKTPAVVEFHAQCDGHHLTNDEINTAIRTLSNEKLLTFFPVQLSNTRSDPTPQPWLESHVPVVAGSAGGLVVLIIIIGIVCYMRRSGDSDNTREDFGDNIVEELKDMDGGATLTIRNPTYNSLYDDQANA